MDSLEADLERARALEVADLADAIESIGFECTRCGACCKAIECGGDSQDERDDQNEREEHTATVFPDEVRRLQARGEYDWRDVARPVPYGLEEGPEGPTGETFEWALQTDDCGDCVFYREPGEDTGAGAGASDSETHRGTCTVYGDRPLVCRTYPFSVALGGTSQPMGEAVDREGVVRAHECEGLGREIDREDAEDLAATLKARAVRALEEAIAVREHYEPVDVEATEAGVVVHDSEGAKRLDGTLLSGGDQAHR